jgi:adenosyl cobinamide kinase/adenosyl cobinamide phosphate guanylyltransferase
VAAPKGKLDARHKELANAIQQLLMERNKDEPIVILDTLTYMVALYIAGTSTQPEVKEAFLDNLEETVRDYVSLLRMTQKVVARPN